MIVVRRGSCGVGDRSYSFLLVCVGGSVGLVGLWVWGRK